MEATIFGSTFPSPLFTGVMHVTSFCDGSSIGQHLPYGSPVMVIGSVLPEGILSLYDFQVGGMDDCLYLYLSSDSWWTLVDVPHLELSAGVGGMGVAVARIPIPILAVDSNKLACDHLRNNSHGEVLQI